MLSTHVLLLLSIALQAHGAPPLLNRKSISSHAMPPLQGLLLVLILASCLLQDCAAFCGLVGDRGRPRILHRRHDETTTRGILHSSQVDFGESAQDLPDDKEGNTGHYTTINSAAIFDDEVDVCDILGQALWKSQVLQRLTNDVLHDPTKPNLSRLFFDLQQSVHPQISTINNAGRGLFTSRDIGQGEIVSLYPVHSVGVMFGDEFRAATAEDDQHYFEEQSYETGYRIKLVGNRPFPGSFKFDENVGPYIDTNPDNPDRPGWVAHLINDCATVSVNGENMADEKTILEYYETVSQRCNCVIVPFGPAPLCAAVMTQTVAKGEELFLSYGHSYWNAAERNILTARIQAAQDAVCDQMMAAVQEVEASYMQEALELGEIFDELGKGIPV